MMTNERSAARRRLLKTAAAALVLAAAPWGARLAAAGEADDAKALIESLADKAIAALAVQDLAKAERTQRFRALLVEHFDIPVIGQWVLGRYWTQASTEQRKEYLRLFEDLIVNTYAERFERYGGEKLVVVGASQEGDQDPVVQTAIVRPASDQQFKVDWRLRRRQGRLMIVDVIVEGVSMGQTQRSEFASAIRQSGGGLDDFLAMLKKRVNGTA